MGTKNFSNANDLITFSRASAGTALRKIAYGSELVTNGDFDTDTTGWTAINATLSVVSGALRVTKTTVNGQARTSFPTVAGKVYALSADLVGRTTTTTIKIYIGSAAGGTDLGIKNFSYDTSGSAYVVFRATTGESHIALYSAAGTGYEDWDNISIKEVLFDQGDLTLFNHPADIPRIEYDADGNVLGLLVEESRTNLVTYSEDFTQPVWAKSAAGTGSIPVVTSNYAVAPDGTNSASRIQMNAGSGTTSGDYSLMRFTVSSAPTTLINSLWIKSNTESSQTVKLSYGASDAVHTATTEWQRFDIVSGNPNFADVVIRGDQTVSSVDLLIWGYQAEAGDFPTSYIPTSGATATRAADVASIPVSEFGYNQNQGTVVVEFASKHRPWSGFIRTFEIGKNGGANQISLIGTSGTNNTYASIVDNGSSQLTFSDTFFVQPDTNFYKVCMAMKENDFDMAYNSSLVVGDTSLTIPSIDSTNSLFIGSDRNGGSVFSGHIKSIKYYPRRLTNAQLQELTT